MRRGTSTSRRWREVRCGRSSTSAIRAGKRRKAKATRASKRAARKAVEDKVEEALRFSGSEFRPSTTLAQVAEIWLAGVQAMVGSEDETRSPGTLDTYRSTVQRPSTAGLGELRISEFEVGVFEDFLTDVRARKSLSTAKLCRTALSGICGLLVRRKALPQNPMRDVARLERGRARKDKRTLAREEVAQWLAVIDADEFSRDRDLPDLVRLLLATGVRLGEALALSWDEVDLEVGVMSRGLDGDSGDGPGDHPQDTRRHPHRTGR